jgi:uncharacterized phage-associated protein
VDNKQPYSLRGIPAAVVGLLQAGRAKGVIINRTKIAKLLYFADLEAVKRIGRPQSGVPWVWYHYGPYHPILKTVEQDLITSNVITCESIPIDIGVTERHLRLTGETPQIEIDSEFAKILAGVVTDYGHLAASSLRDLSYQTAPMLEAQRENAHNAPLDLLGGTPAPRTGALLAHMQHVLDRTRIHEETGDRRNLVAEMDEWAPGRRTANEALGN